MDLNRPFRHVDAIARGALTRHHLVDGSYRVLFDGVSIRVEVTVTMALRAAGAVLAYPGAVVGGLAAAALWGVDVAPSDTLAWPAVRVGVAHRGGVGRAAEAVGWEVYEVREDAAPEWGTRRRPAPIDELAAWVLRVGERWDPAPRIGGRAPRRLPPPPGPDGECDGGLSRLVGE